MNIKENIMYIKIKKMIKRKLQDFEYYYYIVFGSKGIKKFIKNFDTEWDRMSISQRNCILTHIKKITKGRKNGYKREKIS